LTEREKQLAFKTTKHNILNKSSDLSTLLGLGFIFLCFIQEKNQNFVNPSIEKQVEQLKITNRNVKNSPVWDERKDVEA